LELFVGIDVGKSFLDIHIDGLNQSLTIPNNTISIQNLLKRFTDLLREGHLIKLIVCEATGGYEKLLVEALRKNQFPIHRAHANKVRNFAKATGKFAKTDKIDARILSNYAKVFNPKPNNNQLTEEVSQLKDWQLRRNQLIDDLTKERNRLDKNISKSLAQSIKRHVQWLEKELENIAQIIQSHIDCHKGIKEAIDLIISIPGIGSVTACAILTDLPEIYSSTGKQLTALVGVAPMNRDSGTKTGKRYILGGRAHLRKALYMATVACLKWNHLIREFYLKLKKKGKPTKVAIVAAMHKLLLVIKSVITRNSKWESQWN